MVLWYLRRRVGSLKTMYEEQNTGGGCRDLAPGASGIIVRAVHTRGLVRSWYWQMLLTARLDTPTKFFPLWAVFAPEQSQERRQKPALIDIIDSPVVHHDILVVYDERVELHRLMAVWTCGKEARLVPGFAG